jgi:hypothetical protein
MLKFTMSKDGFGYTSNCDPLVSELLGFAMRPFYLPPMLGYTRNDKNSIYKLHMSVIFPMALNNIVMRKGQKTGAHLP